VPSLWRTETHWYRPIRLTDAARFHEDMRRGWVAVGALEPTLDDVCRDAYAPAIRTLFANDGLLEHFTKRTATPWAGSPTVSPIQLRRSA
jgi:hypothetical protein